MNITTLLWIAVITVLVIGFALVIFVDPTKSRKK